MKRIGLAVSALCLAGATSGCVGGGEIGAAATMQDVLDTLEYQCDDGSQMNVRGIGELTIYVATDGTDFTMQQGSSLVYSGGRGTITFSDGISTLTWRQGMFSTTTCTSMGTGWLYLNL